MATFNIEELENGTVYDQDGGKVGKVAQLYLDDASGEPNWVTVNTGLFGSNETFVPLDRARVNNGEIHVPYTKNFIKDAPNLGADAHIDERQEDDLYRYYGMDGGTAGGRDGGRDRDNLRDGDDRGRNAAAAGAAGGVAGGVAGARHDRDVEDDRARRGHDTGVGGTGQYPDERGEHTREGNRGQYGLDADNRANAEGDVRGSRDGSGESVVRHEEELNVGTERVQTGRARLRKRVVTEQETVTVPVEREEVEVVREPIAGGDARGGTLGEEDVEVTLSEERPVVDKDVVAKERVGLDKNVVQDQERIQAEVGREEVDVVEGEDGRGLSGRDADGRDLDGRDADGRDLGGRNRR